MIVTIYTKEQFKEKYWTNWRRKIKRWWASDWAMDYLFGKTIDLSDWAKDLLNKQWYFTNGRWWDISTDMICSTDFI